MRCTVGLLGCCASGFAVRNCLRSAQLVLNENEQVSCGRVRRQELR